MLRAYFHRFLLAFAMATTLSAHDLYLLPESFFPKPGQELRVGFHNGDSFPQSEVAPKVARLQGAQLYGRNNAVQVGNLREVGKETIGSVVVPARGSLLLGVQTTPNFIELAPDKFLAYLTEEGLTEIIAWRTSHGENGKPGRERYSKYAKSLIQSGASDGFYKHALGFPIEIIPLEDPGSLHAGSTLHVQVLLRGKPAPGLQLESAWTEKGESSTSVAGRTDSTGYVSILLKKTGRWRLHCLRMERCSDASVADWESLWASLTFEIR